MCARAVCPQNNDCWVEGDTKLKGQDWHPEQDKSTLQHSSRYTCTCASDV